jgi:HAD superfamily hydrolase (TIGR01509 family)
MRSVQPHKVVLFDHDGTVVDSETIALKSAWKLTAEVLEEFPGARFYSLPEFVQSFAGKPYREILIQLYQDSSTVLSEADLVRFVAEEEDRAIACLSQEARPTQGTPEVLANLRDRGIEFALVSNSSFRRLNACLTAAGLTTDFPSDRIFSAHDSLPTPNPKPSPDIYLQAIACLGADINYCVAVEDSLSGVRSAVAAGVPRVIGYVGGTHINEDERHARIAMLRVAGAHDAIAQMTSLIR